jgi:hypothetical protein
MVQEYPKQVNESEETEEYACISYQIEGILA